MPFGERKESDSNAASLENPLAVRLLGLATRHVLHLGYFKHTREQYAGVLILPSYSVMLM